MVWQCLLMVSSMGDVGVSGTNVTLLHDGEGDVCHSVRCCRLVFPAQTYPHNQRMMHWALLVNRAQYRDQAQKWSRQGGG